MIADLSCDEIKKLIEKGAQLIDVRTDIEYIQGALQGAVNLPLETIQYTADTIDRDKPVILYCRSGHRSGVAKQFLETLGYCEVYNIGGYATYATC